MLETNQPDLLFADASSLYDDALEILEQGRLPNASEKAWDATKRATDGLILARTGREPRTSGQTIRQLQQLHRQDPSLEPLRLQYALRQSFLHGACFYDGILEPADAFIADVRETLGYIRDAEAMAVVQGS